MFEFVTLPSSKPTMVSCVYEGEFTTANQLMVRWENPQVMPMEQIRFRYKLRPENSDIDYDCKYNAQSFWFDKIHLITYCVLSLV